MTDLDLAELRRLAEDANSALLGTSHDVIKATRYLLEEACDPATVLALLAIADRVQAAERDKLHLAEQVTLAIAQRQELKRERDEALRSCDERGVALAKQRAELEAARRGRDALERELELVADALGHIERASDHQRGPASSYVRASGESMAGHIREREREWSQFDEAVGDAFVARSELAEVRARVRALPRYDTDAREDECGCALEYTETEGGEHMNADDVLEAIGGGDGE